MVADWDYLKIVQMTSRLTEHLKMRTPAWAASITGLAVSEIEKFAELYGSNPRSFCDWATDSPDPGTGPPTCTQSAVCQWSRAPGNIMVAVLFTAIRACAHLMCPRSKAWID